LVSLSIKFGSASEPQKPAAVTRCEIGSYSSPAQSQRKQSANEIL